MRRKEERESDSWREGKYRREMGRERDRFLKIYINFYHIFINRSERERKIHTSGSSRTDDEKLALRRTCA